MGNRLLALGHKNELDEGAGEWNTSRGFNGRATVLLQCLHMAVVALANKGAPQLRASVSGIAEIWSRAYHSVQQSLFR